MLVFKHEISEPNTLKTIAQIDGITVGEMSQPIPDICHTMDDYMERAERLLARPYAKKAE